jgi:predicted NUDIX family NTP pyrophosphohydrolase
VTSHSAGILLFRYRAQALQVFLVHPGGPFWVKRDAGAWSIPKGLLETDEPPLAAARREFAEETGFAVDGRFIELGELKQPSGKVVHAWALQQDVDAAALRSNTFTLEWPKGSGAVRAYPEVDRAGWFDLAAAREKLLPGQVGFLDRLLARLGRIAAAGDDA